MKALTSVADEGMTRWEPPEAMHLATHCFRFTLLRGDFGI